VLRGGIELTNFSMEKALNPFGSGLTVR